MPQFPWVGDFPTSLRKLTSQYGISVISEETKIPEGDLQRWIDGGNHYLPKDEFALYGFCVKRKLWDFVSPVLPTYDIHSELQFHTPPLGHNVIPPHVKLRNRPTKIAGLNVNFPFGISASILTRNADAIAFFADRGFDILTYKTVRSKQHNVHPQPNWAFINLGSNESINPLSDQKLVGGVDFWPEDPTKITMANSFGIPSEDPSVWQIDVEKSVQRLHDGQILIVSVVASPSPGAAEKEIIEDFVRVAKLAQEAGAHIIEANYSCPNTSSQDCVGELYQNAELSGRVSKALSKNIGSDTPLFVKIGYLEPLQLKEFFHFNAKHVRGIVAINTLKMTVVNKAQRQLFPGKGREQAGISGVGIRPWSKKVVSGLVEFRKQERLENELEIIALGGASTPQDVYDYLNLGATAVESCTAALLNPYLAIEARLQLAEKEFDVTTGKTAIFADEDAKIAWEISQKVDHLTETLPPEGQQLNLQMITFAPEHKVQGFHAIFSAGTVVGTAQKGIFLIPKRSLKVLDILDIPYRVIAA